jgi:hypothetical protein
VRVRPFLEEEIKSGQEDPSLATSNYMKIVDANNLIE